MHRSTGPSIDQRRAPTVCKICDWPYLFLCETDRIYISYLLPPRSESQPLSPSAVLWLTGPPTRLHLHVSTHQQHSSKNVVNIEVGRRQVCYNDICIHNTNTQQTVVTIYWLGNIISGSNTSLNPNKLTILSLYSVPWLTQLRWSNSSTFQPLPRFIASVPKPHSSW